MTPKQHLLLIVQATVSFFKCLPGAQTHRRPNHKCRNITVTRDVFPTPRALRQQLLPHGDSSHSSWRPQASWPHPSDPGSEANSLPTSSLLVELALHSRHSSHSLYSAYWSLNYSGHFPKSNLPSQKRSQRNSAQTFGNPKDFQNIQGHSSITGLRDPLLDM